MISGYNFAYRYIIYEQNVNWKSDTYERKYVIDLQFKSFHLYVHFRYLQVCFLRWYNGGKNDVI